MELDIKKNITTINQWHDRAGFNIKGIVLHSMAGTQRGTIAWFSNPKAKASAHYCVADTGDVVLTVEEKAVAWHAGNVTVDKEKAPTLLKDNWGVNPNLITIGIEMEDKNSRSWKYPEKQYSACVILVADICRRYDIPMDRGHIFMHRESDPVNKSDPIGKWDHDKFIIDVVSYGMKGGVKDNEEMLYPYHSKVKVLDFVDVLYVREGASKIYPLAGTKKLYKKNEVEVVGFVKGELIEYGDISTSFWWKSTKGNYFWAGGTSLVPSVDNLPGVMSINLKENNMKEELQKNFDAFAVRQEELVLALEGVRAEMARLQEEINKPEEVVVEEISEVVEEPIVEEAEAVETLAEEAVVEPVEENVEVKEQVKVMAKLLEDIKAKLGL